MNLILLLPFPNIVLTLTSQNILMRLMSFVSKLASLSFVLLLVVLLIGYSEARESKDASKNACDVSISRSIQPNGLHAKLKTRIVVKGGTSCLNGHPKSLLLVERFSKDVFLDQFELSERERLLKQFSVKYHTDESTDIEKPTYRMQKDFNVEFHVRLDPNFTNDSSLETELTSDLKSESTSSGDSSTFNSETPSSIAKTSDSLASDANQSVSSSSWGVEFEIPIHFRYQAPSNDVTHIVVAIPSTPSVVLVSDEEEPLWPHWRDQILPSSKYIPFEHGLYHFYKKHETLRVEAIAPNQMVDPLIVHVPTGQSKDLDIVSPVTLALSTLGAFILILATFHYGTKDDSPQVL